jgi:hypothetical protein
MEKSSFEVINIKDQPDLVFKKKDLVEVSYDFTKKVDGELITGAAMPEKLGLFHNGAIYVLNDETGDLVKVNNLEKYEHNARFQYLPEDFDFEQMEKLTGMHTEGITIHKPAAPKPTQIRGGYYDKEFLHKVTELLLDGNYKEYDNPDLTPEIKKAFTDFYGRWSAFDHKSHSYTDEYEYNERLGEQDFSAADMIKLAKINYSLEKKKFDKLLLERKEWEKEHPQEAEAKKAHFTAPAAPKKSVYEAFEKGVQ